MSRGVITSYDRNGSSLLNSFPNIDKPVANGLNGIFPIGIAAHIIEFNNYESNEIIAEVGGDSSDLYCTMGISNQINNDIILDNGINFYVGSIISIPNKNLYLKAIGNDASIYLKLFYSA